MMETFESISCNFSTCLTCLLGLASSLRMLMGLTGFFFVEYRLVIEGWEV